MSIEETEQIHSAKYAGFWRRFLASAVDNLILFLIGIGISFSLGSNPYATSAAKNNLELFDLALSTVVFILYSLLFWVNYDGSTPGKKLLAIKIVHSEGKPLNYGISFIRYLGYFVSLIPLGLGYIWVAFDSKKQGWHDKIAGTYVIKTDKTPRTGLAIVLLILLVITIIIYTAIGISTDPDMRKVFSESSTTTQKEKDQTDTFKQNELDPSILSRDTFNEVNAVRTENKVPVLSEETDLCAYAQRRLDQLDKFGRYDDHKGFIEDTGTNSPIWNSYFKNYSPVNELVYVIKSTVISKQIVDSWELSAKSDKEGGYPLFSKGFDAGCIRADKNSLVFIIGKSR